MTSEKRLREIAKDHAKEQLRDIETLTIIEADEDGELSERDCERVECMVRTWPILDLPVPGRYGWFWPAHGRNYAHVHSGTVQHPERGPERYIRIGRGLHPITMTPTEALELAAILTAAATEEA